MRPVLLAAGYINVDVTAAIDQAPAFGERITARSISRSPGGMTANVACAAARLGLRTRFFGSVGRDAAGDAAVAELRRFGVLTEGVAYTESPTTTALILLAPGGDRAIISEPMAFDYGPLEEAMKNLGDGERACLHMDGYRLPEALGLLRAARREGIATSADLDGLDAGELRERAGEIASALDMAFLNQRLARALAEKPLEAAEMLVGLGAGTVAVTLGDRGAVVAEHARSWLLPTLPVETLDTTGAGDAFAGAFLAAFLEGKAAGRSGAFAVAASGLSVSRAGARGGLPDREEVARALRAMPEHSRGADQKEDYAR